MRGRYPEVHALGSRCALGHRTGTGRRRRCTGGHCCPVRAGAAGLAALLRTGTDGRVWDDPVVSVVGVEHLRAFAAVAEVGSITAASRSLYLVQSAVTRRIAALERVTGLQLFERTSRGVQLTEDGSRFLRGARKVMEAYDGLLGGHPATDTGPRRARAALQAQRPADGTARPVMRLGIEADAPHEATEAVRASAAGRPGSLWRVTRAHEADLRALLLDDHLDAAVVWLPPGDEPFGGVVVASVTMLAAMPSELAGSYPGPAPWSVLAELPLALWARADGPVEYDYWTELVSRLAGPITTVSVPQLDNAQEQMLQTVAAGAATCFVTESHWRRARRPGVEVRTLDPPFEAPLHLLWASGRPNAWVADLVSAF